jgi:hypothetical protein
LPELPAIFGPKTTLASTANQGHSKVFPPFGQYGGPVARDGLGRQNTKDRGRQTSQCSAGD